MLLTLAGDGILGVVSRIANIPMGFPVSMVVPLPMVTPILIASTTSANSILGTESTSSTRWHVLT